MSKYKYLLFDADYTLLDFDYDMSKAFKDMYNELGLENIVSYSGKILELYDSINNSWWDKFELGLCSKNDIYIGRFEEFFSKLGVKQDPEHANTLYFESLSKYGTFYKGAEELLQKLCKTHEIYIITNGNKVSQEKRLIKCGMMKYAKRCFVSENVGVGKPDIRYFEHVFSSIDGFEKDKALVIGDSLSADMQGAINANLDSIWYNPRGFENKNGLSITFEAKDYDEVYAFIVGRDSHG